MGTATNIEATAVNTIGWLSSAATTIVVPVYQRQYRWDIGQCEQLLTDVRAVSESHDSHSHFIGSILSAGNGSELVLIDGQQRITTLMLLVAALHDAIDDPTLGAELERVLVSPGDPTHTRLRPHRAWAEVFESVVLHRSSELRDSRFDDNYAFFRSQVPTSEAPAIWAGLKRLEHVAITLGPAANAQQIFESLNSTGEPLRDHELIHNYVLMGLTHAEQTEIENDYWAEIEINTGESIGAFWRHYLVMTTGREVTVVGARGVYDTFRQQFPRLDVDTLRERAAEWRDFSAIYRVLLDPSLADDPEVGRQLGFVNTFGSGMYPLVMREYRDYQHHGTGQQALVIVLELIQSLQLRRTVAGLPIERLVARLCRARAIDEGALLRAIARITPSDDRVRVGLKYSELPYPAYVLARLSAVDSPTGLDIEHIVPLSPADSWSGDGTRSWSDFSEDEQNSHRALAQTLGNLALLEEPLALKALDLSYPEKRALYAQSAIPLTRQLDAASWGTAQISARTVTLTEDFLHVWPRPAIVSIDDDDLTPILDAKRRRGWPRGWEREFDYVEYRGEHWEVPDIKYLFNRIFKRLWADDRAAVVAFTGTRGGPVFDTQAWNGHWDALDDSHFIYMGWDSRYMLNAVQGVLDEAGIASEVFVKYSYLGAAM